MYCTYLRAYQPAMKLSVAGNWIILAKTWRCFVWLLLVSGMLFEKPDHYHSLSREYSITCVLMPPSWRGIAARLQ